MPHKIRALQGVVEADEVCHEKFERVRDSKERRRMLHRWGTIVAHRHVYCEQRLCEIIREIDWSNGNEGRIARRYAKHCISSWEVSCHWPEPEDLVNEAIFRCMTGDRKLHYPSRKAFPGFLCFTMKSIARGEKEKTVRRGDEPLMEQNEIDVDGLRGRSAQLPLLSGDDVDPVANLFTTQLFKAFLKSIDDPEMKLYVQQREDHRDWEADDHAHAMGVSVQDIYNLNRRLHRLRERWIRLGGSLPPTRPRPRRRG